MKRFFTRRVGFVFGFLAFVAVGAVAGNVGPMMIQQYGADIDNPSLFWANIGGGLIGKKNTLSHADIGDWTAATAGLPAAGSDLSLMNVTPPGGATPRTLSAWLSDIPNVKAGAGSVPGAVGNGTTDDSAAIEAACTAAQAAGSRFLYFPAGSYNVAAMTSGVSPACGNTIFVGQGTLVNAYRKWIFDPTMVQTAPELRTMNALIHSPRVAAALALGRKPVIQIVGDSTSGYGAPNAYSQSEYLYELLYAKIQSDFGGNVTIINRSWAGTSWNTLASTGPQPTTNVPPWATNPSASWQSYVLADSPDEVIFNFGMNDGATADPFGSYSSMEVFLALLKAQPKSPDVVFTINYPPSVIYPGYATQADQEGREAIAGFQRSYAQMNGFGYIDLGRRFDIARDGFDPLDQPLKLLNNVSIASGSSGSYTWPQQTWDYSGTFNSYGDAATFWAAGTTVTYSLSANSGGTGSTAVISNSGGFIAVTVQPANSISPYPTFVSTVPVTQTAVGDASGSVFLQASIKRTKSGARLTITYQNYAVYDQLITVPGGMFTPVISYAAAGDTQARAIQSPTISSPRLYMPILTDYETFGTGVFATDYWGGGGGGANHMATRGIAEVAARVVAAQMFNPGAPAPIAENRVVNGDARIDQPYEGGNSVATGATPGIIIDRWRYRYNLVGNTIYFHRDTATAAPPGYASSLFSGQTNSVASPGSAAFVYATNTVSGPDIADLGFGTSGAATVVVDFWLRANNVGTYGFSLSNAAQTRAYVIPATITAANTWQYFSFTVKGDTSGSWVTADTSAGGLYLSLAHTSGTAFQTTTPFTWGGFALTTAAQVQMSNTAGSTLNITGLRLFKGNYDRAPLARPLSHELMMARRYYQKTFPAGVAPAQSAGVVGSICARNPVASGDPSAFVVFPVPMAATPTVTTFNPSAANANWRNVTAAADVAVSVDPAGAISMGGVMLATAAAVANAGDNLCIHATFDVGF